MEQQTIDNLAKIREYLKNGVVSTAEDFWPKQNDTNTTNTNSNNSATNKETITTNQTEIKPTNMQQACNPNRKLITKSIDIASGTAAGTYPSILDFGKEYKRLIGYCFILSNAGGLTDAQIRLGLSDSSRTILDPTLIDYFLFSTAVPQKDRLNREELINLVNGQVTVNNVLAAVTTAPYSVQMIALLERD